jgi:ribosomal protein S27AE
MAMTAGIHEAPCPQCGQAVSITLTTPETSDQLAADRTRCPGCGASLVRAVEGHADRGWRLEDESGG